MKQISGETKLRKIFDKTNYLLYYFLITIFVLCLTLKPKKIMAKGKTRITFKGKIILEYLERFPKTPSLTLAKKIYKENKEVFSTLDSARSLIRLYRGQSGDESRRKIKQTKFYTKPGDRNPFNLPESHADPYEMFEIKQSNTLILSDFHFPYQDNKAIEIALKYGLEKKVNCILLNGDIIDFAPISRHEKDFRSRSVKEEFDAVRQFLGGLRKAFPDARIIFKYGNHDERWEKWLFVKAPEIFDCKEFQLEVLLQFGENRIEVVKDKRIIKIGKLFVLHGHELAGGSGGVNPARSTFLKTLESTIVGHFHKTSNHTEASMDGTIISSQSQGCLCAMNPLYMPINKWNQGFSHVDLDIKTGDYHLHNLKIIKGKIY